MAITAQRKRELLKMRDKCLKQRGQIVNMNNVAGTRDLVDARMAMARAADSMLTAAVWIEDYIGRNDVKA